jgi:hypothetical protein
MSVDERRDNRGAEGAEGVGCGRGVPSPPGVGSGEGTPENF